MLDDHGDPATPAGERPQVARPPGGQRLAGVVRADGEGEHDRRGVAAVPSGRAARLPAGTSASARAVAGRTASATGSWRPRAAATNGVARATTSSAEPVYPTAWRNRTAPAVRVVSTLIASVPPAPSAVSGHRGCRPRPGTGSPARHPGGRRRRAARRTGPRTGRGPAARPAARRSGRAGATSGNSSAACTRPTAPAMSRKRSDDRSSSSAAGALSDAQRVVQRRRDHPGDDGPVAVVHLAGQPHAERGQPGDAQQAVVVERGRLDLDAVQRAHPLDHPVGEAVAVVEAQHPPRAPGEHGVDDAVVVGQARPGRPVRPELSWPVTRSPV